MQCVCSNIASFAGEPIDERGPIVTDKSAAIHAEAPEFVEMNVAQEILVTGIKVVDLLAPYAKGGKIGNFTFYLGSKEICNFVMVVIRFVRWCWCRQNRLDYGTY